MDRLHRTGNDGLRIAALALAAAVGLAAAARAQAPPAGSIGEVTLFGEEEFQIQAATKTEIPISKAPGPVTVIGAKQIRESGARTIPELLRLVAGVNVRWNPMVQTIDMRSFGQNPFTSRVLLLIDGVPYNSWNKGGFPQHPGFDFFSLQNVKRIEVLRGPGSALYGENAYWGVINVVTLSGEDLEGGRLELYGGDLETRSAGVVYGRKLGAGSFLVSGKYLRSQFPTRFWFEENDAEVEGTDFYLKGEYKGFEASYYRHEDKADGFEEPVELPGLPPATFHSIESIEQTVDIFALKYARKLGGERFSFAGDVSYAQRNGSHCAACHAAPQDPRFRETGVDHGFQLIGDFRFGIHLPAHDVLLGVEARQIDAGDHVHELGAAGAHEHEEVFDYAKLAAYVQDQVSLADDRVRLILGLRYDGSNDLFDEELSPRAAVVWSATEALVVRGGWSRAFRFPSFSELYQSSWFFNLDAGAFAIPLAFFEPNPGLRPEEIETFGLGFQYRLSPSWSAKVDLFYSELTDFMVLTLGAVPEGTPAPIRVENHPDGATIRGAEVELRWAPKRGATGFVNWSYQDPDQDGGLLDSSGKPFEFVYASEHKLNLGAYFGPFAGFSGAVEVEWRDDFVAPSFWNLIVNGDPTVAELDGYTLANVRISYDLPFQTGGSRQPPRISFHGRNLLDEDYVETLVGVDSRMAGRRFYGSFELWF
ncbi:MAG TPA: TonB-dependent receptor [Thermoanaerobaculia bacterium]